VEDPEVGSSSDRSLSDGDDVEARGNGAGFLYGLIAAACWLKTSVIRSFDWVEWYEQLRQS